MFNVSVCYIVISSYNECNNKQNDMLYISYYIGKMIYNIL